MDRTGAHLDYLKSQFALVGDNNGNTLVKDGPGDYCLYTTGRRNVQFAHWWIKVSSTLVVSLLSFAIIDIRPVVP